MLRIETGVAVAAYASCASHAAGADDDVASDVGEDAEEVEHGTYGVEHSA